MVPDRDSLPDDIDALKQSVVSYAAECDRLLELVHLLQAKLFGRKSERLLSGLAGLGLDQFLLFDREEDTPAPAPSDAEKDEEQPGTRVEAHLRRKPKRQPLPAHLPRVPVLHDVPEADKVCGCGAVKGRISDETSEQLDFVRPELRVLHHIRPKYACQRCEGTHADGALLDGEPASPALNPTSAGPPDAIAAGVGIEAEDPAVAVRGPEVGAAIMAGLQPVVRPTVVIAPPPPQIIPKSIASPGLLAHVMAAKFVDSLPFYRQEGQFLRMGVHIGRATMCGWAIQLAKACEPLLKLLWQEIRAGPLIQIDESPLQVLRERGRAATTNSYMWAYLGGGPGHRGVVFEYSETRSSDMPKRRLEGYRGGVQTDDYSGYDFIGQIVSLVHFGCLAHVRRKFTDVLKAVGSRRPEDKKTLADEGIAYIRRLYEIEWVAQNANATGDDLVALRREKARPVLDNFQKWLLEWSPKVPPKNLLGKAISYTLGLWPRLERYIDYAFVTPDNNLVENAFRPYVLGRKNWLFSVTPAGANATALFYSLVETAKLNGVEPYSYLRCLFECLPYAHTDDDRRELLPQYVDRKLVKPYIRPTRGFTLAEPAGGSDGQPRTGGQSQTS